LDILIAGMGAIGSLFAGYLTSIVNVHAIGRPWHINEIKNRGYLTVKILYKGEERKVKLKSISTSFKDYEDRFFDYIIVSVKAYDTKAVLEELVKYSVRGKCYALLQNGYGNEDVAREVLGEANIMRILTNNGAYIESPGVVVHAGLGETFIGGVYGINSQYYAKELANIINKSGLPAKAVDNIEEFIFMKLVVNAVINPLTAILNIKNKAIVEDEHLRELAGDIVREVVAVAKAKGIKMDYEKALNIVLEVARKTGENISSMLQDIRRGKRTEIDFINGAIAELAEKYKINTPINKCLYMLVKAVEAKRLKR